MTEEEALFWLIRKHQRSDGLNAFCRILLALELEPWFKARARCNQQLGGQKKGSSNLSEADRLDVRSEIAAAGVSAGNVSKVKHLASAAHSHVLEALRAGQGSIHQATVWLRKPAKQLDALGMHQNRRGITTAVNSLLRAHREVERGDQLDAPHIAAALARLSSEQSDTILVAEVKVPGVVLLVSTALRQGIDKPRCTTHMSKTALRKPEHRLRQILELTRDRWDTPTEPDAVRANFRKVCACRTPALGGEVYASGAEERVFYHTCKSRCCPSCGNRGTQLWQRDQWATLPDIPFVGVVLTMPDVFWPIFQDHRHLQHDLPALGAAVLQQYARNQYRVRLYIVIVQHTFGGRLNHHPHLHIMASAGGLNESEGSWVQWIEFDREQIMRLWRFAVTSYLWKANRDGLLHSPSVPLEFDDQVLVQSQRRWNIYITRQMTKKHFLGYAGRYIRRLPISQKRILDVTRKRVAYRSKDTRTKMVLESSCTLAEFIALLSQHVPDRYRHSMRYFGLLAPRTKRTTSAAVFLLLGQEQRPRPRRLSWRNSLLRDFQVDPLRDNRGQTMSWVRRLSPALV
jgi:Putative transposase/Transposase zinc-binding domain